MKENIPLVMTILKTLVMIIQNVLEKEESTAKRWPCLRPTTLLDSSALRNIQEYFLTVSIRLKLAFLMTTDLARLLAPLMTSLISKAAPMILSKVSRMKLRCLSPRKIKSHSMTSQTNC